MNGYLVGALTFVAGVGTAMVGELLSEEVRDRLDQIPRAILRLAARLLDSGQRTTIYEDEWVPELSYILTGAEARPVSRLIIGSRYALGILVSTRRIARHLHRDVPGLPSVAEAGPQDAAENLRSFAGGRLGLLVTLAGGRREILAYCPTERVKFQSLGGAILATCAVAAVSMWFALTSALGVSAVLAVPVAALWGLMILGIDRWLVISLPASASRRLALAMPRLAIALLAGSIISTPIVLRVFQSEINSQIPVLKDQRATAFSSALRHSPEAQQVATWTKTVITLQKVINSSGAVPISPPSDPVIQSLRSQQKSELALEQKYYRQWQCELNGGPGCLSGNGALASATETSYNQARQQVSALTTEIQAQEKHLLASDAASQKARYAQATSELPAAQQQLKTATAREDALANSFYATNQATNGLLIRLQALTQLTSSNATLDAARLLLFLLFLVIECLPLTVKLLQRPGNYELILKAVINRELSDALRISGHRDH